MGNVLHHLAAASYFPELGKGVRDGDTAHAYFGAVDNLAKSDTHALGIARSDDGQKTWTLLGLLPMLDPPRPDAADTIAKAKALGIDVKMVTGDDVAIGSEISRKLGIGSHLLVAGDVHRAGAGLEADMKTAPGEIRAPLLCVAGNRLSGWRRLPAHSPSGPAHTGPRTRRFPPVPARSCPSWRR
ncbi:HAD family hydrolase [Xanthobacter sp. TB0136]|uniref:HAD family hydrolase n=1 Tax=Xanthobacter sp. TB0136 TaxID=3459177 RepID=UPI0040391D7F